MPSFLLALLLALWPGATDDAPAASSVQAAAEAMLARQYPGVAPRLEVRVLRTHGLPEATWPLRVHLPASAEVPRARVQVAVEAETAPGTWTSAGWAMLYVAHYDSVLIPQTDLAKDAELPAESLTAGWMETTRFRGQPLHPDQARALMATHSTLYATRRLPTGRALRTDDVRPPYAANTGDVLVVRYQRGRIQLDLRARARERGFPGDLIRAYADDTDIMYRVRLTGPGTASWIETLSAR
ncbi:MAG: flagella basal body P-ring formation protein FlgA [Bacteroidota bacterium]